MTKMDVINERMNCGMLINLDGNEIVKKPYAHPYDFDEYIQWIDSDFFEDSNYMINTNDLYSRDPNRYNTDCYFVWQNTDSSFEDRTPNEIENFLSVYFNVPVEVMAINKYYDTNKKCVSWNIYYRFGERNVELIDLKKDKKLHVLDMSRQREHPLFGRYI